MAKRGRPRGPLSLEEREQRRQAGLGRSGHATDQDSPPVQHDPASFISATDDAEVSARWSAYLKCFGIPRDWSEALTAEKVHRELSGAISAGVDLSERRGKLVAREDVGSALRGLRDAIVVQLAGLGGRLVGQVESLSPDLRQRIAMIADKEVGAALDRAQEAARK